MQLEYLEYATLYVNSINPDPATKDILARWTDVLKLESDPMQLGRELDWVTKRELIDNLDRRRGRSGRRIPSRGILLSWATNHQNFRVSRWRSHEV